MMTIGSTLMARSSSTGVMWQLGRNKSFLARIKDKVADRKKPVVSVLHLQGPILANTGASGPLARKSNLNIDGLQSQIERAFAPDRLEAVLLKINSPGGSPTQCELISDLIWLKAKEKQVPVISFVEDMAASGGYWLACTGDQIYVSKSSVVGSIGVIWANFGLAQFIKRYDISWQVYTAGKSKNLFDPFQDITPESEKILKSMLQEIHENFKNHIRTARKDRLKAPEDQLFTGEIWIGQKAVDLGLADGIDTLNAYIHREYGQRVKIQRIKAPSGPLAQLLGRSSLDPYSQLWQTVEEEALMFDKFRI